MAFFLIGRGPDDDLRLISAKSFETRQAAMAELSLLSAEPTFAHWDDEVSVMDLESGAPVLLVRSGVAAAPAAEAVVAPVDAAGAWEADLPQAVAEEPAPVAATTVAEPILIPAGVVPEPTLTAEEPALAAAPEASTFVPGAIEAPFWEPPSVALIEPVADEAIADAIVQEAPSAEPEPDVESGVTALEPSVPETAVESAPERELEAVAPAQVATEPGVAMAATPEPVSDVSVAAPAVDENDELRAAILRTTEHMSAEGVVPPESVGLVPAESQAFPETEPETASQEPEVAQEPSAPPRVGFWPWARAANSSDAEGTGVAPEVAGVYDALQEPATELPEPDVETALRNAVLLPAGEVAAAPDHGAEPHLPMSSLPAPEAGAFVPPVDAESVDSSDFILDLDAVESAPVETADAAASPVAPAPSASDAWSLGGPETSAAPEPSAGGQTPEVNPEPVAAVSSLQDYTCEDCVYVTTCPNRDQRLPKDCGSFQWR
ncbi:MAG: hypothetical protein P4L93_12070 [Coriobacteriia bacterium]|nr:hypothetical protein [Coriobacteriia bacterium]